MKRVYIVGGNGQYRNLFRELAFETVNAVADADLICFTGGEDVSPDLYGDMKHDRTWNNPNRDAFEQDIFNEGIRKSIPMVGICRGGQFLNVMSGGRMYQHVTKHAIHDTHDIVDVATGEHYQVTSTHHQMFLPSQDAEIVAIATLGGEREWYDGEVFKRDVSNTDYEVLFYPKTKCLCFQPHPEFSGEGYQDMKDYFSTLLHNRLGV